MSIVGDIVSVVGELRGLRNEFAAAKQEKRERISDYFQNVSDCLKGTYESLAKGDYPHQRCAEMATYADLLPATLKGIIDDAKANDLANRLRQSHEVEKLHARMGSDPAIRAELPKLAEAAGTLAALGTSIRAGLRI